MGVSEATEDPDQSGQPEVLQGHFAAAGTIFLLVTLPTQSRIHMT